MTLKVKYADFQQITRSRTLEAIIGTRVELDQLSRFLLEPVFPVWRGIRLLGVSLSSLSGNRAEGVPQLKLEI